MLPLRQHLHFDLSYHGGEANDLVPGGDPGQHGADEAEVSFLPRKGGRGLLHAVRNCESATTSLSSTSFLQQTTTIHQRRATTNCAERTTSSPSTPSFSHSGGRARTPALVVPYPPPGALVPIATSFQNDNSIYSFHRRGGPSSTKSTPVLSFLDTTTTTPRDGTPTILATTRPAARSTTARSTTSSIYSKARKGVMHQLNNVTSSTSDSEDKRCSSFYYKNPHDFLALDADNHPVLIDAQAQRSAELRVAAGVVVAAIAGCFLMLLGGMSGPAVRRKKPTVRRHQNPAEVVAEGRDTPSDAEFEPEDLEDD
ncbi:unnamed protein product [Amoebophrya sp. A25]|nr:unnamed protein product [Amoebophrya sp. A25]|eukprot:GSA25T00026286001.1